MKEENRFGKVNLNRVLTFLAIAGILSGIYMLLLDRKTVPVAQPLIPPPVSPFENFIAGAGIVEAASENVELGAMVGGVVEEVLVQQGQRVPKGHPLFIIDRRQAIVDVEVSQAQLETAKTALEQAKATEKAAQHQLDLVNKVADKRGVSQTERVTLQDNVTVAQKGIENAQASVKTAEAQVKSAQTMLNFYTITAPIDCEVMQINIHPGEYAPGTGFVTPLVTSSSTPLMVVGDVNRYHVRVNIDENDAWRFNKDEPAVAFLRGNSNYHTNLKFEYIEPYVIPKPSFTGDATERVDTRVLQVLYSYNPKDFPAYLGQEVDVYIRADKIASDVRYGGPLPVSR